MGTGCGAPVPVAPGGNATAGAPPLVLVTCSGFVACGLGAPGGGGLALLATRPGGVIDAGDVLQLLSGGLPTGAPPLALGGVAACPLPPGMAPQ